MGLLRSRTEGFWIELLKWEFHWNANKIIDFSRESDMTIRLNLSESILNGYSSRLFHYVLFGEVRNYELFYGKSLEFNLSHRATNNNRPVCKLSARNTSKYVQINRNQARNKKWFMKICLRSQIVNLAIYNTKMPIYPFMPGGPLILWRYYPTGFNYSSGPVFHYKENINLFLFCNFSLSF